MSLPKVLIVGQPFNNSTGGGITLSNLFTGWDKDKIAVVCSSYLLLQNVDTRICNTYYQLGSKEHKFIFPFNLIQRKYQSGIVEIKPKGIQAAAVPRSKSRDKMIFKYFFPFLKYIGLFNSVSRIKLSKELCQWLDEYKPDVIYVQASSRKAVLFCQLIYSYLKKPLAFHMMDDWPSTLDDHGLFRKSWQKKIDREFRKLLNSASVLMSISDEMAKEYKRRYDKNFITFHNPIDVGFWKKFQRANYELSNPPSMLYAGRIGTGIAESLELIAKEIESVNKELGIKMQFILQTEEKPAWTAQYPCVVHRSFVAYEDLPKVFAAADFLIMPYDFSRSSINFIRYSMPTKAPEYMASGTPIIIFAPEVTAIVKYAQQYGWAKLITENKPGELSKAIRELVLDIQSRQQIAQNAVALVEKYHDSQIITGQFRTIICSLTGKAVMN